MNRYSFCNVHVVLNSEEIALRFVPLTHTIFLIFFISFDIVSIIIDDDHHRLSAGGVLLL